MLNILWSGMIIAGILYSVVTGNVSDISNAALDSSKEAVTLCITMLGVMAFWCGLMQIAEDAGLVEKMSGKMQPVIHFLFPQLPKNHPANKHITTNIIANILGLGWAATPAGLQAMEELAKLEESRRSLKGIASNEMCNFLIDLPDVKINTPIFPVFIEQVQIETFGVCYGEPTRLSGIEKPLFWPCIS